jgi:hypothetical protein
MGKAFANELGRLAQGIRDVKGTNTIAFIHAAEIPNDRTVTYGRLVCDIQQNKSEQHRVRLTVGGDRIDYPGETATKNADPTTSKCLWNSTISTTVARYMCADVKKIYLNTPLDSMRLPLSLIPQEIIDQYQLEKKAKNGQVYIRIDKGMYGLPHAGRLANDLLVKRPKPHGYYPVEHTHGLWRHETRTVTFTLVVDDFGIKCVGKEHANHLLDALKESYEVTEDWEGKLYCGITLKWDYKQGTVDIAMPGYIESVLHKFQHMLPNKPQYSPYQPRKAQYGRKVQLTPEIIDSPTLDAQGKKRIQQVVGALL